MGWSESRSESKILKTSLQISTKHSLNFARSNYYLNGLVFRRISATFAGILCFHISEAKNKARKWKRGDMRRRLLSLIWFAVFGSALAVGQDLRNDHRSEEH